MIAMATDLAIPEVFSVGSFISCKTCTNKVVNDQFFSRPGYMKQSQIRYTYKGYMKLNKVPTNYQFFSKGS